MTMQVAGAAFAAITALYAATGAMAYPVSFSATGTFTPTTSDSGTFTSQGGAFSVNGTASTPFDYHGNRSMDFAGLPTVSGSGYVEATFGRYNGVDVLSLHLGSLEPYEAFTLLIFPTDGPKRAGDYELSALSYGPFVIAAALYSPTGGLMPTDDEFYSVTLNTFSVSGTATLTGQVSPVPLPSSAPLFGAALLALAGGGYSMTRKRSAIST